MAEALDGPHVGLGYGVGLFEDGVGSFEVQCCWTQPGNRELIMTGNLSTVSGDAINNMKDRVCESIPSIANRLAVSSEDLVLMKRGHDLHVHIEHSFHPIKPSYQMGAIYVALVSLMIGRRPRKDTVVFGDVGNRTGVFSSPWKLGDTVHHCVGLGYRRAVVGKSSMMTPEATAFASRIHVDGEPFLRIISVDNILDALTYCFEEDSVPSEVGFTIDEDGTFVL